MTVRELIAELLKCEDLDEEVFIDLTIDKVGYFNSKISLVNHYGPSKRGPAEVYLYCEDALEE